MTIDKDKYHDLDDLGLYLTLIESTSVTFNPKRTIEFRIIRPLDHSEKELRYTKGSLTFKNVLFCDLRLLNEYYEYPEFYRSAILEKSELLKTTKEKFKRLGKSLPENVRHYYLYVDQGNDETEVHIICENHELTIESEPKFLTEFNGLNE